MNKYFEFVVAAVFTVAFAVLGALIIIEWLAGCGESYTDARGIVYLYECVFIPQGGNK
jgi:hypothetical protein